MTWAILLKITHVVATALGVGGSTLAEVFLVQSARAGKLDEAALGFLRGTYQVIRVGTILLIFSGFGYFLLYRLSNHSAWLYEERLWMKLALIVVIALNSLLFQQHKISTLVGSAVFFTSWYAALILGAWRGLEASLVTLILAYLIGLGLVLAVFAWLRKRYHVAV